MKKIIITGASSGLGYRLAEVLASRGVRIGIAARRTERLEELQKKYPGKIIYRTLDVNHPDAHRHLSELIHALGGMDIYVHAAGIGYDNPLLDPRTDASILETNVVGFSRMICTAYDYFRNHGGQGQIAAITSVAGTKGVAEMAAYSASKAGASAYLQALRQLADKQNPDIYITDIRPGWTRTPLLDDNLKYPMEMDTDTVIVGILKALIKHPRVAIIDNRWNLLVRAWNLIPGFIWEKIHIPMEPEPKE